MARSAPAVIKPDQSSEIQNLKDQLKARDGKIKDSEEENSALLGKIRQLTNELDSTRQQINNERKKLKEDFLNKLATFIRENPKQLERLNNQITEMLEKKQAKAFLDHTDELQQIKDVQDQKMEKRFSWSNAYWWFLAMASITALLLVGAWFARDHKDRQINDWKQNFLNPALELKKGN